MFSGYHRVRQRCNSPDKSGRADVWRLSTGQDASGSRGCAEDAGDAGAVPGPGDLHRAPGCGSVSGRKRRHVIPLRLTEKELKHLNQLAAQSGLSREQLLRALIMGETIRPRPCTHHEDLLRKVSGLCNNANQLAHQANSTGRTEQKSVEKMIALTREVYNAVKLNW